MTKDLQSGISNRKLGNNLYDIMKIIREKNDLTQCWKIFGAEAVQKRQTISGHKNKCLGADKLWKLKCSSFSYNL